MSIYIKNATYIDWQSLLFTTTDILVEEGKKGGVRFVKGLSAGDPQPTKTIDAKGKFVTKSFGCGHHHIYSTLARGMPAPAASPKNFTEILKYIWWNVDKSLDREMIKASAQAAGLYCAKNGITFVIDHHASPFAVEDSLFTVQEAFDSIGLSHLLCYELSDRDGEKIRDKGLQETANYLKSGNQGHVGLHASFTVGDTLLKRAVQLAGECNTGLHVHVAEDLADQIDCLKEYNKRVLERYFDAGGLDLQGCILAHCIHLNDHEKALLKDSTSWVVENVESNLNNNVGLTDYSGYGNRIMLGTDGMHSDMLRSAKAAFFVGQGTERISYPGIYERFRNVHRYIAENKFSGDGDNNLVILDYQAPTPMDQNNFLGHFVFGLESCQVESVISSGRLIVDDRRLVLANEEDILGNAKEMAQKLWKKLS